MDREFSRILFMADGPELLLKPTDGSLKEGRGFLRGERRPSLCQLGAQDAKWNILHGAVAPGSLLDATHGKANSRSSENSSGPTRLGCELLEAPLHHGLRRVLPWFEVSSRLAYGTRARSAMSARLVSRKPRPYPASWQSQ